MWTATGRSRDLSGALCDNDGQQGTDEATIAGLTVTVTDSDGNVAGTATTDSTGRWRIGNLRPDDEYAVTITPPEGAESMAPNQGDEGSDSDVAVSTGAVGVVLSSGENSNQATAGILAALIEGQHDQSGGGMGRIRRCGYIWVRPNT